VENRLSRLPLTEKQREREERIIAATQTLMASFPGDHFTIAKIALALRMTPASVRRYFIDVESILAEILLRHLTEISRAIGKIPNDHPNRHSARRAAYMEITRTGWGGFTEPHQLLIRARCILPEDLAKPIELMRQCIGEQLAGDNAETAFTLLDTPHLQAVEIEAMMAHTGGTAAPAKPADPPAPAAPPVTHPRHYNNWKLARRLKAEAKRQARAGPPGP